jgi:hypothetical protein
MSEGKTVVVPVEPTEEMMRAMTDGFIAVNGDNRSEFERGYARMIASAPASTAQPDTAEREIHQVYDLIGLHHSQPIHVLMANLSNMKRFAEMLHAVEREFFMVPGEPDEDYPDAEPDDECLVNSWGSTQEQYIEQFRAALNTITAPQDAQKRDALREALRMALEALKEIDALPSHDDRFPAESRHTLGKVSEIASSAIYDIETTLTTAQPAPMQDAQERDVCGCCNGSGRMVRDPDIGTDQECFACDGTGKVEQEEPADKPEDQTCDANCTWADHHPDCVRSDKADGKVKQHACLSCAAESERQPNLSLKVEQPPVIKDSLTTEGEPVAWIPLGMIAEAPAKSYRRYYVFTPANSTESERKQYHENCYDLTPLYAHPPAQPQPDISTPSTQARDMSIESGNFDRSEQLTDEEILALWHSSIKGVSLHPEVIEFARALLSRHKASGEDKRDAERWRETLRHIGGTHTDTGAQRFTLRYLSPVEGANIMRGSVAGHFTSAIDAAMAAQRKEGAA